MDRKTALITGITGQDGSYLAELLLGMGYDVHGTVRRISSYLYPNLKGIQDKIHLHYADMTDAASLAAVVRLVQPDEVYNLAGQSHVHVSFQNPAYTLACVAGGTLSLMQAIDSHCPEARVYQASSSEMFGNAPAPQNEDTPFRPVSPYAIAKVAAHETAVMFRDSYGLHVSCGILFNHESPRRPDAFVTRKIVKAACRIGSGLQDTIRLGNVWAIRDWGYAGEYVQAMWQMLQRDTPTDFVIGTGRAVTVAEFGRIAFEQFGKGFDYHLVNDESLKRPSEVANLCADPTKARDYLKWESMISLENLIDMMIKAELTEMIR